VPGTRFVMRASLLALLACLAVFVAAPPALAAGVSGSGTGTGSGSGHASLAATSLARIGGFRSPGFGSRNRGFGSRNRGFGSRRGRGGGIFRSIIRALALGYLLHLLFTTPGGLIVLLLMILAVALLMSRFRRRRLVRY
jgi:hypothetical protein